MARDLLLARARTLVMVATAAALMMPSAATVYTVGDTSGWMIGVDYNTWATGKSFAVGDTLVFNYGAGHTVDEVSQSDYSTCTSGNAITSDSSGANSVTLRTAGNHYFMCGIAGHCGSGMKLAITVAGGGPTTTLPSGTTTGTGTGSGTATSPPHTGGTNVPGNGIPTSYYYPYDWSFAIREHPFIVMVVSSVAMYILLVS